MWTLLPSAIPNTFKRTVPTNSEGFNRAHNLSKLGLIYLILLTLSFAPAFSVIAGSVALVIWIVYWIKIVKFKEVYLLSAKIDSQVLT